MSGVEYYETQTRASRMARHIKSKSCISRLDPDVHDPDVMCQDLTPT